MRAKVLWACGKPLDSLTFVKAIRRFRVLRRRHRLRHRLPLPSPLHCLPPSLPPPDPAEPSDPSPAQAEASVRETGAAGA
uniref:Uncharacterized protein n=1 Tax=Chromera velia CCMP2878 TaxID=1169474 RepID=A0A0G4HBG8_9ALVE|eukprot:Cvel_6215.t1-p1 / transcript=Cvel_6215.t1 / gene=Cvel_6215 / organism=Chromera_velia_CCMP2878 / gene_product=hypothetical protein / transcript_product=hypothetical protein / location=Cvel_scaffold301:3221-3457(-) / protein_length=79 / sequence_SO=supercontig / SO=protein_coding / is_pseudo=false